MVVGNPGENLAFVGPNSSPFETQSCSAISTFAAGIWNIANGTLGLRASSYVILVPLTGLYILSVQKGKVYASLLKGYFSGRKTTALLEVKPLTAGTWKVHKQCNKGMLRSYIDKECMLKFFAAIKLVAVMDIGDIPQIAVDTFCLLNYWPQSVIWSLKFSATHSGMERVDAPEFINVWSAVSFR